MLQPSTLLSASSCALAARARADTDPPSRGRTRRARGRKTARPGSLASGGVCSPADAGSPDSGSDANDSGAADGTRSRLEERVDIRRQMKRCAGLRAALLARSDVLPVRRREARGARRSTRSAIRSSAPVVDGALRGRRSCSAKAGWARSTRSGTSRSTAASR